MRAMVNFVYWFGDLFLDYFSIIVSYFVISRKWFKRCLVWRILLLSMRYVKEKPIVMDVDSDDDDVNDILWG